MSVPARVGTFVIATDWPARCSVCNENTTTELRFEGRSVSQSLRLCPECIHEAAESLRKDPARA